MTEMISQEFLKKMPKTELHLHLEGTISPETLWKMAQKNHVSLPVSTLKELRALYEFESFDKFVSLWQAMCRCFKSESDYAEMVEGFSKDCRRQNIRYAELHFTPFNHEKFAIGGKRALKIVTKKLEALEKAGGPIVRLITDIPAEAGEKAGEYTARLLEEEKNPLIVAIGLGGPEAGFPRKKFAPYYERARKAGYFCVAHAGETEGSIHVREAIVDLKAVRIQHGVRAAESQRTLNLLKDRNICCDVALTSNLCLKVVKKMADHPIQKLLAAKIPLTLNTDDPPFFNTDLVREYQIAHEDLGLSLGQLWEMNLNGLRYSLCEVPVRRRLMMEFKNQAPALLN